MNGRPLSTTKKVRILIAFTILAWATHTLLHQSGMRREITTLPAEGPETNTPVDVSGGLAGRRRCGSPQPEYSF